MSTVASNTEVRSYESIGARLTAIVEYGSGSSESIDLEAWRRLPPLVAGTRVRAFNASAILPPNPTVTRNMIGNNHPSNPHFFQLCPPKWTKVQLGTVRQMRYPITVSPKWTKISCCNFFCFRICFQIFFGFIYVLYFVWFCQIFFTLCIFSF